MNKQTITRPYPLSVFTIGCADDLGPELRRALEHLSVHVAAEFPGVTSALAAIPIEPIEKHLLVVHIASDDDIPYVQRLNDSLPGQPILAVVNTTEGLGLFVHAMHAGAAQVVGLPLDLNELKTSLDRIAIQFGYKLTQTPIIAVAGVAEGSGATTLSINLAAELARLQPDLCILTELSRSLGRLATHLDIQPKFTTLDLLDHPEALELQIVRSALTEVEDRLQVLAGPYLSIPHQPPQAHDFLRMIDYARQIAGVVVIDMAYSFDDLYFSTLSMAHHVLLVCQQNVSSFHATSLLRDEIARRGCAVAPHFIVNRYNPALPDFSVKRYQRFLETPRVTTIANDHHGVVAAAHDSGLLRRAAPHSPALDEIQSLACLLLGLNPEEQVAPLRNRITKKLSRLLNMKLVLQG